MPGSRAANAAHLLLNMRFKLLLVLIAVTFEMTAAYEVLPSNSNFAPSRSYKSGHIQDKYITSDTDHAQMVLIPEGPFTYGITLAERGKLLRTLKANASMFANELPKQTRQLKTFYIDQYEVTNAQYRLFLKATGHRDPRYWNYPQLSGHRQPVVGVSYSDADAYCRWAGKQLPSEEEWEKAARGTDGRYWPWGNKPDKTRYNGFAKAAYTPVNVGSFSQGDSFYGVSDMAGNVWEMTSGKLSDGRYAMRGGSFSNRDAEVRTTRRWGAPNEQDRGATWLGFRCVKYP